MCSTHNREKFPQPVQTQLSQKSKNISQSFIAFLKSTCNCAYLEKKNQFDGSNILEVVD